MEEQQELTTWDEGVRILGEAEFEARLRRGALVRFRPDLYGPPGALQRWHDRLRSVCEWAGPRAVASHASAAQLQGLELPVAAGLEVTVEPARNPRRKRAKVHRAIVPDKERRQVHGIPCTSVAWTVLELASVIKDPLALAVLVESAWRAKPQDLRDWLGRLLRQHGRGRRGMDRLAAALLECNARARPFRSKLEVVTWDFFLNRQRVLPLPQPLYDVTDALGRMEIDFAWPSRRVGLEMEGRDHLEGWVKDRRRSARLTVLGWHVIYCPAKTFRTEWEATFGALASTYFAAAVVDRRAKAEGPATAAAGARS